MSVNDYLMDRISVTDFEDDLWTIAKAHFKDRPFHEKSRKPYDYETFYYTSGALASARWRYTAVFEADTPLSASETRQEPTNSFWVDNDIPDVF